MPDEQYSEWMRRTLARTLTKTKERDLLNLYTHFQQRGGPGLELVEAEMTTRGLPLKQPAGPAP
ncbi:hypothetical protein [Hymenobacter sp. B81]|uniref:hypothetical protein n=1 Tax=Hymenobacter sp. B81 TaxID=3344878 RepID=UPI0037DD6520